MKKALITLGLIIVSAAVGGTTAYLLMNRNAEHEHEQGHESWHMTHRTHLVPIEGLPTGGNHFTSYTEDNYPDDLIYAAENAVQAVVNIEITQTVGTRGAANPLLEFFGYSQPESAPRERKSGGSGVIISPDGYVVTNAHVVENAGSLRVKLYDGRTFEAEVVGSDVATDIALIKVDGRNLPALPMGDSDILRLGERVLAIGSPFDLHSTITAGIISAKSRNLGSAETAYGIESFLQTDAAVNPGNSGGALVNTHGELVGINTLIKSPTGTFSGYSFAVPTSIVSRVVYDLKEYGIVQRGLLGVSYVPVSEDFFELYGEEYGIDEPGGFYVGEVDPDGAARAAGVQTGDVIIAVDGTTLGNSSNLSEVMSRYRPNDKVRISVKRDGKVKHFDLTLRNKAGKAELLSRDYYDAADELGGTFAEVDGNYLRALDTDHGIRVVNVGNGGILSDAGVREGLVITHINERPINSVGDLKNITSSIVSIDGVYPDGRKVGYMLAN